MMNTEERAQRIAHCTCGKELPARMRERGDHFSNCHVELVPEIMAALTGTRTAALREAAAVARDMAVYWRRELPKGRMALRPNAPIAGEEIADAIEALIDNPDSGEM